MSSAVNGAFFGRKGTAATLCLLVVLYAVLAAPTAALGGLRLVVNRA